MSASEQDKPATGRAFPSPLTILLGVIVLVWLAAFLIPAGQYQLDELGRPIPGSYEQVPAPQDLGQRVWDLVQSPINGLYGIQDPETGQVGPFNTGFLFGSAQVFAFILAIGGFMTVVFATRALDLGIAHLAHRFRLRGPLLIVILSVLFGILGSVMSWSDETLGFYALMIPLLLTLGYDRMVVVAVVTVAPFVGVIGSTVNPFRIGIGSDAAGVSMGDGIGLRVVLFVAVMLAMILYTLRYASRVKDDAATSIVGLSNEDRQIVDQGHQDELAPLSGNQKGIIGLVIFTFALMIFSIVPWGAILQNEVVTVIDEATYYAQPAPFAWELGWWLPELAALFVVMGIVIGLVGRLGEQRLSGAFMKGMIDFTGPALLVVVARAVSVIFTNTQTLDTILNAMEGLVSGTSAAVFVVLLSIVSIPLGFFVGSGSAGMALVMPVLAPLGDFASVDRSLIVTIYNAIGGWLLLVVPTNALLMAGLALGRVPFDKYLRFMAPLMAILLVIIIAVSLVGLVL